MIEDLKKMLIEEQFALFVDDSLKIIADGGSTRTHEERSIFEVAVLHLVANARCSKCGGQLGYKEEIVLTDDGTVHDGCSE